jgi:RhtB (resistance to homoserine/threonine) family protein
MGGVTVTQLFSIGFAILLSAMLPGQDFALVVKNTMTASRRIGLYTSLGIASGLLVHVSYCVLGLAVVIAQSDILFNVMKYAGAAYLLYLGVTTLFGPATAQTDGAELEVRVRGQLTPWKVFRQGFVCNVLNPKATLFFLALFTMVVGAQTPGWMLFVIGLEVLLIPLLWFSTLTIILSHPKVYGLLSRAEGVITKLLGVTLLFFAFILIIAKH